ncbi:MAG: hypothetical protein KDC95_01000 [Planctomycetes bacterium]|nr:hypothetical protein [Planctomycetota bacterium]
MMPSSSSNSFRSRRLGALLFVAATALTVHASVGAQYIRVQSLTPGAATGFVDAANKVTVGPWAGPGLSWRGKTQYFEESAYATQIIDAFYTADATAPFKAVYSAIDARGTPGYHQYLIEFDAVNQDKVYLGWSQDSRSTPGLFFDARLLGPRDGVFANQKVRYLLEVAYYVEPSKLQQQERFGYGFSLDARHLLNVRQITGACGTAELEVAALNASAQDRAALQVVRIPTPGIAVFIAGVYGQTIDLSRYGATGCMLGVAEPIFVPLVAQNGSAFCPRLPPMTKLPPWMATAQALVVDPTANAAGFTLTNTLLLRWFF